MQPLEKLPKTPEKRRRNKTAAAFLALSKEFVMVNIVSAVQNFSRITLATPTQVAHARGRTRRFVPGVVAFVLTLLALPPASRAATLPVGFGETLVADGLSAPTAMAFAPDGRLFVCQQGGQLRVIKNGVLLPTPFLSLTVDSEGERGLLGIAFDPDFPANGYVYVYYTVNTTPRHNRVSRFTAAGDTAVAGSETVILELDNLSGATNHNGGAMHFGRDGKLYIAVGENATPANAQTLVNLLGKILRVNADGTIPADNPFYSTAAGKNRAIWALGLRNPFTFAFQPETGHMFINDVGQSTYEEINDGVAGANYGWPNSEGPTSNAAHRGPLYWYGRGPVETGGCAITGGTFYNPAASQFPNDYVGSYFFADFCSGWIRRLDPASGNAASGFASGISSPVDLKVGPDGVLYYLARGSGAVFKIQYTAIVAPAASAHPASQTVAEGQPATFSVTATGTAPLSYQWQRDGSNIAGANASTYTTPPTIVADTGARFRCVISNSSGSATSNEAVLTVTANQPPPDAPHLLAEENSTRAIALDSVTWFRDPFPLSTPFNFSVDGRTRVMLFAANLKLLPGENSSAVSAEATDSQQKVFPLAVEAVATYPGFEWLTYVVVRLSDELKGGGDVQLRIKARGVSSNSVVINLRGTTTGAP
ncbi:MAG TPA: PQQ-dependent sugar dehydrogenase [Pyrinomonadaceae bacterium]|nr:PQQ-dependent sugar dehydrogenase [Pyrinomonadaceae bacterium]